MVKRLIHDDDVTSVLNDDGIQNVVIDGVENQPIQNIEKLKKQLGEPPWAVRIIYNELFGGVLIYQNPGEGNRTHYHDDADECWLIIEGEWEWYIEGVGVKTGRVGDIILVKKGIRHKIKCVGDKPAMRLAITRPDVDHIYVNDSRDEAYKGTRFSA